MSVLGLFQGVSVDPGVPGGLPRFRPIYPHRSQDSTNSLQACRIVYIFAFYTNRKLVAHPLLLSSFISESTCETTTLVRLLLQCAVL